jgi:hypothetical protein
MDSVYIQTVAVLFRYKHLVYIYLSFKTLFTTLYTEQPHRHGLVLSGVIKVNLSTPLHVGFRLKAPNQPIKAQFWARRWR